jgi:hypothetical protein
VSTPGIHYEPSYETPPPTTPASHLARVVCVLAALLLLAALALRLGVEPATRLSPGSTYVAPPSAAIYLRPLADAIPTCVFGKALGTLELPLPLTSGRYGVKEQSSPGDEFTVSCDQPVSIASGPQLVAYPLLDREVWILAYLLVFALAFWLGWPRVRRRFVAVRRAG